MSSTSLCDCNCTATPGYVRHRQCAECGQRFHVGWVASEGSTRNDKLYCSNRCRQRAYRKRNVELLAAARAAQLYTEAELRKAKRRR